MGRVLTHFCRGCITEIISPRVCFSREWTVLYCHTYFEIQMHYIVPMQEGYAVQDLLGQSDYVLFCEGLIVIGNTLVEDFTTGSAEGKHRKEK